MSRSERGDELLVEELGQAVAGELGLLEGRGGLLDAGGLLGIDRVAGAVGGRGRAGSRACWRAVSAWRTLSSKSIGDEAGDHLAAAHGRADVDQHPLEPAGDLEAELGLLVGGERAGDRRPSAPAAPPRPWRAAPRGRGRPRPSPPCPPPRAADAESPPHPISRAGKASAGTIEIKSFRNISLPWDSSAVGRGGTDTCSTPKSYGRPRVFPGEKGAR